MRREKGSQDDQSLNMAESLYAAADEKTVRVQTRKGEPCNLPNAHQRGLHIILYLISNI